MSKPGRNDPCSCGSGKKFKKCCGAKVMQKKIEATNLTKSPVSEETKKLGSFFQRRIQESQDKT